MNKNEERPLGKTNRIKMWFACLIVVPMVIIFVFSTAPRFLEITEAYENGVKDQKNILMRYTHVTAQYPSGNMRSLDDYASLITGNQIVTSVRFLNADGTTAETYKNKNFHKKGRGFYLSPFLDETDYVVSPGLITGGDIVVSTSKALYIDAFIMREMRILLLMTLPYILVQYFLLFPLRRKAAVNTSYNGNENP